MKKGILFVLTAAFLASCQQEENEGVASGPGDHHSYYHTCHRG